MSLLPVINTDFDGLTGFESCLIYTIVMETQK